jgi:hypothetical protein
LPAGEGVGRDADVAGEAGDGGAAGVGEEGAGVSAVLGGVGERGDRRSCRVQPGAAASWPESVMPGWPSGLVVSVKISSARR